MKELNETKELYYYTSSNTMRYILSNTNIYATNLKYMNDSEEYVNGLAELRKLLNDHYNPKAMISDEQYKKAIKEQTKSYSISFSHERNLLSQWSMYAKESGVCIRMDFSKDSAKSKHYELVCNNKNKKKIDNILPYKVFYLTKHVMKPKEYATVSKKLLDDLKNNRTAVDSNVLSDIGDGIYAVWRALAPYVKRKEFFQEAEYRLVFNLNEIEAGYEPDADEEAIHIDYRIDNCVLKPYLDVKRPAGWPVKEIIIGPGTNQKMVFESVKHFLDNANIKVPLYDLKEIRKLGKEFLERLEEDENVYGIPDEPLSKTWSDSLKPRPDKRKIIESFNEFLSKLRDKVDRQNVKECLLDYVYMSPQGIILSISETPFLY